MLEAPNQVDAAFQALINSLDAEISELRRVGAHYFHVDGAPEESQRHLQLAESRARMREELSRLYEKWQKIGLTPPVYSENEGTGTGTPGRPILIRDIKGMTIQEVARRLGVKSRQVSTWLEEGTLNGFRPTGGRWKITPADFMTFVREHKELF